MLSYSRSINILICLVLYANHIYSQEINMNLEKVDTVTSLKQDFTVYDINGEVCNLIILKTDLKGLKFYSNRGIERIEKSDSIYKIWTPPGSTVLKIAIPGFPLYEHQLPRAEKFTTTSTFSLSAFIPEVIIYKDTLRPFISITSSPANAKVYLNKKFIGLTPLKVNTSYNEIISYEVKKKKFFDVSGTDTILSVVNNYDYILNDFTHTRRFFILASINGQINEINGYSYFDAEKPTPGLTIGQLGKTSWYFTVKYLNKKPVAYWKPNDPFSRPKENYPYDINKLTICAGVTQQIAKSVFIIGGAGYTRRNFGYVSSINWIDNDLEVLLKDSSYKGITLNLGFVFRLGLRMLMGFDTCLDFAVTSETVERTGLDFGYVLGYNFGAKKASRGKNVTKK